VVEAHAGRVSTTVHIDSANMTTSPSNREPSSRVMQEI
jgi:hypothetical protein